MEGRMELNNNSSSQQGRPADTDRESDLRYPEDLDMAVNAVIEALMKDAKKQSPFEQLGLSTGSSMAELEERYKIVCWALTAKQGAVTNTQDSQTLADIKRHAASCYERAMTAFPSIAGEIVTPIAPSAPDTGAANENVVDGYRRSLQHNLNTDQSTRALQDDTLAVLRGKANARMQNILAEDLKLPPDAPRKEALRAEYLEIDHFRSLDTLRTMGKAAQSLASTPEEEQALLLDKMAREHKGGLLRGQTEGSIRTWFYGVTGAAGAATALTAGVFLGDSEAIANFLRPGGILAVAAYAGVWAADIAAGLVSNEMIYSYRAIAHGPIEAAKASWNDPKLMKACIEQGLETVADRLGMLDPAFRWCHNPNASLEERKIAMAERTAAIKLAYRKIEGLNDHEIIERGKTDPAMIVTKLRLIIDKMYDKEEEAALLQWAKDKTPEFLARSNRAEEGFRPGDTYYVDRDHQHYFLKSVKDARIANCEAQFERFLRVLPDVHSTDFRFWRKSEYTNMTLILRGFLKGYKVLAYTVADWNTFGPSDKSHFMRTAIQELMGIDTREGKDVNTMPNRLPLAERLFHIRHWPEQLVGLGLGVARNWGWAPTALVAFWPQVAELATKFVYFAKHAY